MFVVKFRCEMLYFSMICLGFILTPSHARPRYYNEPSYYDEQVYDPYDQENNYEEAAYEEVYSEDDPLKSSLSDLPANGELFEGDIVMDDRLRRAVWGQESKKSAIEGLKEAGLMWPGGILYYEIDPNLTDEQLEMLSNAMGEFENRTCIRFKKHTNEKNFVYYTNWKDECSSNIGMSGGKQNITLGKDCGVLGTFEHETMHALGFIHEHSRPDRDDYIQVNFTNIKKDEWVNFQKYKMDQVTNLKEVFNFASIMLYRNDAFTNNGEDTLTAVTEPDLHFGQRVKFSAGDIKEINNLYNCQYYLDHPNYHHLYKEYHTERRKRKKDVRKDVIRKWLHDFLLDVKERLRREEELGY